MTPITRDQIVRASLQAILQGSGSLETRIDGIIEKLLSLPNSERRAIAKALKGKLSRALRGKSAQITSAEHLSTELYEKLDRLARESGAQLVEASLDPQLIAGYQLQIGDDRTDHSLQAKLQPFKNL